MKNKESTVKVKRTNKPGGGRIADKNSNRQRGYRFFEALHNFDKDEAIPEIVSALGLVEKYTVPRVSPKAQRNAIKKAEIKAVEQAHVLYDSIDFQDPRSACLTILSTELDMEKPYASTLTADFRRESIKVGNMFLVYRVVETEGVVAMRKHYQFKTYKIKSLIGERLVANDAIDAYVKINKVKNLSALNLALPHNSRTR